MLDEPANGLDPAGVRWLRDLLRAGRRGRTILVSSHLLSEMELTSTRRDHPSRQVRRQRDERTRCSSPHPVASRVPARRAAAARAAHAGRAHGRRPRGGALLVGGHRGDRRARGRERHRPARARPRARHARAGVHRDDGGEARREDRQGQWSFVNSELLKLRTTPRPCAKGLLLALLAICRDRLPSEHDRNDRETSTPRTPCSTSSRWRALADVVALILGVGLVMTWEYRHDTITETFLVEASPRAGRRLS